MTEAREFAGAFFVGEISPKRCLQDFRQEMIGAWMEERTIRDGEKSDRERR